MSYNAPPPPPGYGAPMGGGPQGTPPKNNLVWAILCTILCCLPLGIVSIVYAAQVNGKWAAGDYAGAQAAADKAKKFAIIGAIVGFIVTVILVIVQVVAAMNASESISTY